VTQKTKGKPWSSDSKKLLGFMFRKAIKHHEFISRKTTGRYCTRVDLAPTKTSISNPSVSILMRSIFPPPQMPEMSPV
jgi:hypothetical protein